MRTIDRDIVGAFIFSRDNYLLLGKSRKGGVYQDCWIVPGGGIEANETLLQTVQREAREEVGVDISQAAIEQLEGEFSGQSTKILQSTGEEILVKMRFYNFRLTLDHDAQEIPLTPGDDIIEARWHKLDTIADLKITKPMEDLLTRLGYLTQA